MMIQSSKSKGQPAVDGRLALSVTYFESCSETKARDLSPFWESSIYCLPRQATHLLPTRSQSFCRSAR